MGNRDVLVFRSIHCECGKRVLYPAQLKGFKRELLKQIVNRLVNQWKGLDCLGVQVIFVTNRIT